MIEDKFAGRAQKWDTDTRLEITSRFVLKIKSLVEFKKVERVLDFGCGTGLIGLNVAEDVSHMIMLDTSTDMISKLKSKIADNEEKYNNIEVVNMELSESKVSNLDLIVSFMTFHHVDDIDLSLKEMYSRLIPEGQIIIGDLCLEDGSFHPNSIVPHNGFDNNELINAARRAGFSQISVEVYDKIYRNNREYPLLVLCAKKI